MKLFYSVALVAALCLSSANLGLAQKFLKGMDSYKRSDFSVNYLLSMSTNPSTPVLNIKSPEMMCRTGNITLSTQKALEVTSDDVLYLSFDVDNRSANATQLMADKNIWGPCVVYLAPAKADNSIHKWFKIYEYVGDSDAWCSEKIIANDGILAVPMKPFLKSDTYIIRAEVIGLNMAEKTNTQDPQMGAQFYPSCGLIKYTNTGSTVVPNGAPVGVPFPGYYKENHPALKLDIMTTTALSYISKMASLGPPEYDPPAVAHDGSNRA
ncbi:hypothetical protein H4S04_005426 [Coemansia sp. S16]|nr:hypothetical protein H4S04_005426 [Coemansia sp. S16]